MDDRIAGGQGILNTELGAINGLGVELRQPQGVSRHGGNRAGQPHEAAGGGQIDSPSSAIQQLAHLDAGGLLSSGSDAVGEVALGQAHAADIETDRSSRGVHTQNQLGGASPEIDDEPRRRPAVRRLACAQEGAGEGQSGLLLAGDHLGGHAEQAPDALHEVLAVAGVAGGGGGHETAIPLPRLHAEIGAIGGIVLHDGERPLQGGGVEHAGAVHSLPKTDDLIATTQRLQMGAPGSVPDQVGNEQANRIGAAVDGGDACHGRVLLGRFGRSARSQHKHRAGSHKPRSMRTASVRSPIGLTPRPAASACPTRA